MKDCEQCLFTTFEKEGVYQIQCSGLVPGPGHVYCTLIVGEEKAMLVDNGYGDDDFWPYLTSLTDKPITAVATHVHPDHTGGAKFFDELWINPGDEKRIPGQYGVENYCSKTHTLYGRTKIRFLEDGQKFDLGGRTVTAIFTPGHTWGSTCFYDDKAKIMLTGDTLNQHVFLFCAEPAVPLATYRQSLEKLKSYDYDIFLGGHHPLPFKASWVDKMLDMIRRFSVDKLVPYVRPEFGTGLSMFVEGRGFGDPNYCGFMVRDSELDIVLGNRKAI